MYCKTIDYFQSGHALDFIKNIYIANSRIQDKYGTNNKIRFFFSNFQSMFKFVEVYNIFFTLETSNFFDIKFEDISATKGTPFVSGIKSNSTP